MQDSHTSESAQSAVEDAIISGILSARIRPGTRLSENQLASLFSVSRTRIREAMMRLETRGIVTVSPRRGWFVVEPSAEESIKVYEARRIIEYGLLRNLSGVSPEGIAILADHLDEEKAAIAKGDRQRLTCLMGDFHIRIAEIAGNDIIVETLRDLTARTILISMLYKAADFHGAAELAIRHLDEVETGLDLTRRPDPLYELRNSLSLQPLSSSPKE